MVIDDSGILTTEGNGKELKESFGRFGSNVSDNRWDLERFGLCDR
jgi:hypothetical protein